MSALEPMWRYITEEDVKPQSGQSSLLFVNLEMKVCTKCRFMDTDAVKVESHYIKNHGQVTLAGKVITRDERIAALLEASPNPPVCCPFCFAKQRLRAMRKFNEEGVMLKLVTCVDCKKNMQLDSVEKTQDAYKFGVWVGNYKGFWHKVDHDRWITGLKKLYGNNQTMLSKFWDGYGFARPEFAKKREIERQAREYEQQWTEDDNVDEAGK